MNQWINEWRNEWRNEGKEEARIYHCLNSGATFLRIFFEFRDANQVTYHKMSKEWMNNWMIEWM